MVSCVGASSDFRASETFSTLYVIGVIITQIAVRILFISAFILMAAAAFPVMLHPVAIPVVAISASFMAAFFYQPE